jgi:hypothetical protein
MANKRKKPKNRKARVDPRTSNIVPKAGPVTIRRADGTVEIQPAIKGTKYLDNPYPSARVRKIH